MMTVLSTSSSKMVTAAMVVASPLTLSPPAIAAPILPNEFRRDHREAQSYAGASWLGLTAAELATRPEDAIAEVIAFPEPDHYIRSKRVRAGSYAVGAPISAVSSDAGNWAKAETKANSSQVIAAQQKRFQELYSELHSRIPDADPELLADASHFYEAIKPLSLQPSIWSDEGEVAFEWKTANKHAIVSFDGDGSYGYALLLDGKFKAGQTEMPSPNSLPTDLLAYLETA